MPEIFTVDSVPASYTSAHDALWFVVSSPNSNQNNFKYVFMIYNENNFYGFGFRG